MEPSRTTVAIVESADAGQDDDPALGRRFWLASAIEGLQRLATFAALAVFALYVLAPLDAGGLSLGPVQVGVLLACWGGARWWIPTLAQGATDRLDPRLSLAAGALLAAGAYLVMPLSVGTVGLIVACLTAGAGTALVSLTAERLRETGHSHGALARQRFFRVASLGAMLGAVVAALLRPSGFGWVFGACAAASLINVGLAFWVGPVNPSPQKRVLEPTRRRGEPRFTTTVALVLLGAGVWLLVSQVFVLLPVWITAWVQLPDLAWLPGADHPGPEWLLAVYPGAVMLMLPAFAAVARLVGPAVAISGGAAIVTVGLYFTGQARGGLGCVAGILVLVVGEMLYAHGQTRRLAGERKALDPRRVARLTGLSIGAGWVAGALTAGFLVARYADPASLARHYLITRVGQSAEATAALSGAEAVASLGRKLGLAAEDVLKTLAKTYDPHRLWMVYLGIGGAAVLGLVITQVVARITRRT